MVGELVSVHNARLGELHNEADELPSARVVRGVRERVQEAVSHILDETTIHDLMEQQQDLEAAQSAMFYI